MGGQSQMDFSGDFLPDFSKFDNLVLAASIFLFYAGMEMGGIHVKDINNPAKNYPKAVFIGSAITVIIFYIRNIFSRNHHSSKRYQPNPKLTGRIRQLFQLYPHVMVIAGHRRSAGFRSISRSTNLGCRSVKRYICRRKSRVSASILPKNE